MTDREGEATGSPWSRREIDVAVDAYLQLRLAETRGRGLVKSRFIAAVRTELPVRTVSSIERKLSNISAILDERGEPWIDGYKPLSHYQGGLADAVDRALLDRRLSETVAEYQSSPVPGPSRVRLATSDVTDPAPGRGPLRTRGPRPIGIATGSAGALDDFRNRKLGTAGEEWVIDLEREQLRRTGRPDLARSVEWVARTRGDGAGFDVRSFDADGDELLIEVKTTNLSPRTPFYITRWEVEVSDRERERYSLYRVYDFARNPRLYRLDGSVSELATLDAKVYLGIPI
jgi:hypothetical protein